MIPTVCNFNDENKTLASATHNGKANPSEKPKGGTGTRGGKGTKEGQGNMRRDWKLNQKRQHEEYEAAQRRISPSQLVSDSFVAQFLQRLRVDAALDLDGNIFIRDKSLVSHVLHDLPLKTAKESRNCLVSRQGKFQSASHGSLRSSIFFAIPVQVSDEVIADEFIKKIVTGGQEDQGVESLETEFGTATATSRGEIIAPGGIRSRGDVAELGLDKESTDCGQIEIRQHPVWKLVTDSRKATATLVISTQQETDEAVIDVVNEVKRVVIAANNLTAGDPNTGNLTTNHQLNHRQSTVLSHFESQKRTATGSSKNCNLQEGSPKEENLQVENLREALSFRRKQQRELHERFERLLKQLTLDMEEAMECERRGILRCIAHRIFLRSWKGGLLRNVPFVREDGEVAMMEPYKLGPGLFIPARNAEGLICGLQFRPRLQELPKAKESEFKPAGETERLLGQEEEGEVGKPQRLEEVRALEEKASEKTRKRKPKYVWVSRDKSIKGDRGCIPFFCVCCRWSCREHTVAFVEGGLKAYAFAFLARRFPVIGGSGGQWHECGEALLHALARLNARRVLLFADAGAVRNAQVLLDYLRTLRLVNVAWGIEVLFVWWGQSAKDGNLDCDSQLFELRTKGAKEDAFAAAMLTPAAFWAQVPNEVRSSMARQPKSQPLFRSLEPLLGQVV